MLKRVFFATICLTHLLVSCTSQTTLSRRPATQSSIEEIAQAALGSKYIVEYNASKSYALCQQKETFDLNKYILIKVMDRKATLQGQFRPGYIKWVDNDTLEILDAPGIIKKDQSLSDFKKSHSGK